MSNIKLKNASGTETTYSGVTSVKIPLADGSGNATFSEGSSLPFFALSVSGDGAGGTAHVTLRFYNDDTAIGNAMTFSDNSGEAQITTYQTLGDMLIAFGLTAETEFTTLKGYNMSGYPVGYFFYLKNNIPDYTYNQSSTPSEIFSASDVPDIILGCFYEYD